jgi:hypothetical protein
MWPNCAHFEHACLRTVYSLGGGKVEGLFTFNMCKLVCEGGAGGGGVADSGTGGGGCVLTFVYNPPRNVQSVGSCTTSVAKSDGPGLLA